MQLEIVEQADQVDKVRAVGRISLTDLPADAEPLGDLLGGPKYGRIVLLDLTDVDFIDSSGISWLIGCHKRFVECQSKLIVHSTQPMVESVFKIVRIKDVLNLASNEREAEALIDGGTQ